MIEPSPLEHTLSMGKKQNGLLSLDTQGQQLLTLRSCSPEAISSLQPPIQPRGTASKKSVPWSPPRLGTPIC